jgi:hypothetical protein
MCAGAVWSRAAPFSSPLVVVCSRRGRRRSTTFYRVDPVVDWYTIALRNGQRVRLIQMDQRLASVSSWPPPTPPPTPPPACTGVRRVARQTIEGCFSPRFRLDMGACSAEPATDRCFDQYWASLVAYVCLRIRTR